mgnify:CR=1 FL=1
MAVQRQVGSGGRCHQGVPTDPACRHVGLRRVGQSQVGVVCSMNPAVQAAAEHTNGGCVEQRLQLVARRGTIPRSGA